MEAKAGFFTQRFAEAANLPPQPYFDNLSQSIESTMQRPTYALITGGSNGIGKALAVELARRKYNLLLVALNDGLLPGVAAEIRSQYDVAVDYLGIDLTQERAPAQVHAWCREKDYVVSLLINNAGFGRGGLFQDTALEEYYRMIELNNRAAVGLTYLFLPGITCQAEGRILFVSSMEATMPLPYKAVYTGTKNFLYAFALAIREELKRTSVQVSILCPGPVLTNEDGKKRLKAQGKGGKVLVMMPEAVAKITVPRMLRGQRVIIPGTLPLLINRVMSLVPIGVKMSLLERVFRVYKKDDAETNSAD